MQATPTPQAGIGLKTVHVAQILRDGAAVDFFEVHAENYMVAGGPFLRHLEALRARWPLSIHGVGLSIGAPGPLDEAHLQRLQALLERFEPQWFSEHLAWSSHGGRYLGDLLPLPYHRATLQRVCEHIDQVQTRLGRRLLLENPSRYVAFDASTMDEAAFLTEVQRRSGCGLLVDVNNAYVSAVNQGCDAWELLGALPPQAIGEVHLAGHRRELDSLGDPLLIDTHDCAVADPVWSLYRRLLARLGRPVPTLIERDAEVPPLQALEAEAARARRDLRHVAQPQVWPQPHPHPQVEVPA
jgi:hypothetical protein